ncbi:HNH endonuclease [Clostridium tyrobutyricum]|uniref:HNH endonuclease n=1 Tax=Clostridium tyrobutyricum TaxID=1519 RepID=UPI001C38129B|nr:HNH endonuclease [Clostridium tyrobutyricum]MBV4426174.1 HNH endonuclease [Clostridium tyrobutyricum]
MTDSRIIDLIDEVDSIRDACNKEFDTFISKELKPYIQLIQERLAYYKIKPKTIAALKVSKDQIPPLDWAEISQALENKIIPENTRKLITANLKALRKTAKAKKAKKPVSAKLDPSIVVDANEVFIREFISKLGVAYAIPVIKDPEEPTTTEILDDLYNTIDVLTLANTQGTSVDAVEDQQKSSELWYSDFNNIVQPLAACLEISLNNISPETVLSDEALSHGAIKAMLAFAKTLRLKVLYKLNANIIDYTELSKELHHQIQVNTNYYTDAEPLPEVVPMSKVQLIDSVSKGTAPILPSLFDLTPPIQDVLDSIKANAVTTGAIKVLSDSDVKSIVPMLVPVNDYTIKEIANMLTGQPSTPYLADGALVIHTIETGKYLKVVPTIVETKYAEYQFRSYNWDTLNGHIHSLQQLLAKTTEYIKWQAKGTQKHSYKLLSKAVELRKIAIKEAEELYGFLLDLANRTFDDVDNDDDAKAMKAIRKITSTHYYKDFIRISGHRLSAWVYYLEDYRLISNPPIDANGYEIDYEPNHINGVRSDNRPSNLKIELKQVNLDLRSTSRPVKYNGQPYLTLKKYCDAFGLSYDYLRTHLPSLQPGETKEHDNGSIKRAYCLDADGWTYIATDVAITITATQLVYSGKEYATPKEFAADLGLDYEKIRQGLYRAKKKDKTEYKCKEKNKTYTFYLDTNGNVTKIL